MSRPMSRLMSRPAFGGLSPNSEIRNDAFSTMRQLNEMDEMIQMDEMNELGAINEINEMYEMNKMK